MTTARKLSFTCTRTRLPGLAVLCLAAALVSAPAPALAQAQSQSQAQAQDSERLSLQDEELLLALTQQMAEARELFEDQQRQSQSIEFLDRIVSDIEEAGRTREEVAAEVLDVKQQALELRARAFFNAGQLQGAADDFRQILLDNPRFTLDAETLSPRIVDFFEDQKKQLIGYIAVSTEPAGARVEVNGTFVGITNFFPIEVHTGIARVEVSLAGYEGYLEESLRIEPGEITTLDLALTRTSARLPIITDPPGVEVLVDGEPMGVTSGTLPPDLRSFMPAQFDPSRLSAPFELNTLSLGRHEIELRLDCYRTVKVDFTAEEPRDYTAQIVKLEESIGRVSVTSNPSDATVFLDGELKGNTPLDLNRVCAGEHRLEVKHATGKYVENITVGADESLSFECPIRPTLAVLDIVADEGVPARDLSDIRASLSSELPKLAVMNVVFLSRAETSRILGAQGPSVFVAARDEGEEIFDRRRDLSERLGRELEVEALLVPYVPAQRLTKDVVLNLLAVGSVKPDSHTVNYLDRASLPAFVELLSEPTRLFGSWLGLTAIDTRLKSGPIVMAVEAGGPAEQGGVSLGDIVLEAAGTPTTRASELLDIVHAAEPGSSLSLTLMRGGTTQTLSVTVGTTPVEVPMNEDGYLYNKALIDLRHRMVVEPEVEDLARLNAGLCHMQLGDFETALRDYLPRVNLPQTAGIAQGTAYYYTALAYLRLGEREEAARLFQQALAVEGATLQSNDGPRVAPLAQRRLRELGR